MPSREAGGLKLHQRHFDQTMAQSQPSQPQIPHGLLTGANHGRRWAGGRVAGYSTFTPKGNLESLINPRCMSLAHGRKPRRLRVDAQLQIQTHNLLAVRRPPHKTGDCKTPDQI